MSERLTNWQTLRTEFDSAINLWLAGEETQTGGIRDRFDALWLKGPCAVLRYASEYLSVHDVLPAKAREALVKLCDTPIDDSKAENNLLQQALFLLKQVDLLDGQDSPGFLAHQLIQLTLGHANAVLAADAVVRERWTNGSGTLWPSDATHYGLRALASFQQAWPLLTNTPILSIKGTPNLDTVSVIERAHEVIEAVVVHARQFPNLKGAAERIDPSSWLIVRRLFDYLFNGRTPIASEDEERLASFLTVGRNRAECGTLHLSYAPEGQSAIYIDPVETGLLLLDREMLNSLLYGWLTCRSSLRRLGNGQPILSLRLTPQTNCRFLNGNSAGGMFQVAIYAMAKGEFILDDATASFAIDIRKEAKAKVERNEDIGNEDFILKVVDHETVNQKVARARHAGKKHVLFFKEQTDPQGNDFTTWQHATEETYPGVRIHSITTLAQATAFLTGNTKYEQVLQAFADATAAKWLAKDRPERFIEPHYARIRDEYELRDSSDRAAGNNESIEHCGPRERLLSEEQSLTITLSEERQKIVGDQELTKLVRRAIDDRNIKEANHPLGARLILAEDANAGKTVFSYRLKHFFACKVGQNTFFHGKPPLVHRWENRDGSDNWPNCEEKHEAEVWLRRDLENAIKTTCEGTGTQPSEVVDYALKWRRIVLIFDAADQARNVNGLRKLLADESDWKYCHAFITGRSFYFQQGDWSNLVKRQAWTRTIILGFDDNQKARYLDDVLPRDLRAAPGDQKALNSAFKRLFENYDDVAELLEVPGMIEMARKLVDQERKRAGEGFQRLTQLRTRADFYWEYYVSGLQTAIRERTTHVNLNANGERYRMMLAVTAFRMVLERLTTYSASDTLLDRIKDDVIAYCQRLKPRIPWTGNDSPDVHWENMANFGALSNHHILEPHLDASSLSWRHKGWMEFFLAVFLANYASPAALCEFDFDNIPLNGPPIQADDEPGFRGINRSDYSDGASAERLLRDVMIQITNDPQWYWGWRMATELPRVSRGGAIDRACLASSLGMLYFEAARGIRPTELMYHAFYLFEQDELTPQELRPYANLLPDSLTKAILIEFRKPLQELLARDIDDSKWSNKMKQQRAVAYSLVANLATCPPLSWVEQFDQLCAKRKNEGREATGNEVTEANRLAYPQEAVSDSGPSQRVQVEIFCIQTKRVTRAQYRLFDDRFETSRAIRCIESLGRSNLFALDRSVIDVFVKDHDSIACAHWYDAFMFAKFLGSQYRLPLDREWGVICQFASSNSAFDMKLENRLTDTSINAFWEGPTTEDCNVMEWCADSCNTYGTQSTNSDELVKEFSFLRPLHNIRRTAFAFVRMWDIRATRECSSRRCDIGFRVASSSAERFQ